MKSACDNLKKASCNSKKVKFQNALIKYLCHPLLASIMNCVIECTLRVRLTYFLAIYVRYISSFFLGGGQLKKMSAFVYELTTYQEHKLLLKSKHPK